MASTIRRIGRAAAICAAVLACLLLAWPLPDALTGTDDQRSLTIRDRNGALLYEVRSPSLGLKTRLPLAKIPSQAVQALVAVEDRSFYSHRGISLRGISRAAMQNAAAGEIVSGGSTITQQLVRNLLQSTRRDVAYKAYEAYLAMRMELMLSKDDILEEYLNTAYFGHQAYGIAAAAQTYFGKRPLELSLAENALLIGLVQSPSVYDPFRNFAAAKDRQHRVLQAMVDSGVLPRHDADEASDEPIALSHGKTEINAPHFVFWLLQEHPELAGMQGDVRTTLDLGLQRDVERIVDINVDKLADSNVTSAAVVVLDAHSGDVLAMVGSRDYFDEQHDGAVNVATSARQPGSALKPFVYALAMAHGDTPATTVADVETQFFTQDGNPYVPRNYDYGYHGLVRYREALANSYNIAAVKTLEKAGVPAFMDFLRGVGITTLDQTPEHYGLALALGDAEVRLFELTQAYGMFARGGVTLTARALLDEPADPGRRVLDGRVAWLVADILSDNQARLAEFGESSPLLLPFPAAAKTGTTRNSRDNWTVGFTNDRIVGVWVGNADNSPMRGTSGITGAGPIYHDVMLIAGGGKDPGPFQRPQGIVDTDICRLSGLLATDSCPQTLREHFVAGTQPTRRDDMYRDFTLDRRNGQLAGPDCPADAAVHAVFAVFPPELQKWARENGWKQPPTTFSPLRPAGGGDAADTWLQVTKPSALDAFALDPLIPDDHERIIFEARASGDVRNVRWSVDGKEVGSGSAPDFRFAWSPTAGTHRIGASSGQLRDDITVTVTAE